MIVARASTEAAGQGALSQVTSQIISQVPGSDAVAVNYPAALFPYQSSEEQGVAAMTLLIEQYVAACPTGKIALLGYSQVCSDL
jgi:acetylxylan esterase